MQSRGGRPLALHATSGNTNGRGVVQLRKLKQLQRTGELDNHGAGRIRVVRPPTVAG